MEDRESPVLYLEMTELTPEKYAETRVPEVSAVAGVERATWWRNVYRDRPDLPRELSEFDTLGVYECAPSFVALEATATCMSNALVADLIAIVGSLDTVMGEVDR